MNSTDSLLLKIEIIIYWRNWTWNTEVHSVRSVLFMKKSAVYQLTRKMEDDPDILWYLPRIYLWCSYWQTRRWRCERKIRYMVHYHRTFDSVVLSLPYAALSILVFSSKYIFTTTTCLLKSLFSTAFTCTKLPAKLKDSIFVLPICTIEQVPWWFKGSVTVLIAFEISLFKSFDLRFTGTGILKGTITYQV